MSGRGSAVEVGLVEFPRGTNNFVARIAARGNQNHHNPAVRQQDEAHVFEDRLVDGRGNHDPQPSRNFRQHMSGTFGDFLGGSRCGEFTADPVFILGT